MPVLVDLINQVQKILPIRFGGTGNDQGYATERLILPYMNDSTGTVALGTLVKLKTPSYDDRRVVPSTLDKDQHVIGVVVGRFSLAEATLHQFEAVAPGENDTIAVCVAGRCSVLVSAAVSAKQFAFASSTAGQAYASSYIEQGCIGQFETSTAGAGTAQVRLFGGPSTPGMIGAIYATFGDGVTSLQAGTKGDCRIPFNISLLKATLLSTASGSCVIDIYVDTYANFPATNADSITSATPPTISSGIKSEDSTLGSWTKDLDAGDTLRFEVESASSVSQVTLVLDYVRR